MIQTIGTHCDSSNNSKRLTIPRIQKEIIIENKSLGYCGLKNLSNTCHFNAAIQLSAPSTKK